MAPSLQPQTFDLLLLFILLFDSNTSSIQYCCYVNVFTQVPLPILIHGSTLQCGVIICDRILENSSKSPMKSSVFLHDISTYVFMEYFLQ